MSAVFRTNRCHYTPHKPQSRAESDVIEWRCAARITSAFERYARAAQTNRNVHATAATAVRVRKPVSRRPSDSNKILRILVQTTRDTRHARTTHTHIHCVSAHNERCQSNPRRQSGSARVARKKIRTSFSRVAHI